MYRQLQTTAEGGNKESVHTNVQRMAAIIQSETGKSTPAASARYTVAQCNSSKSNACPTRYQEVEAGHKCVRYPGEQEDRYQQMGRRGKVMNESEVTTNGR